VSPLVVARILLAAATVLITGCTSVARVAYNNGDIAARFMANEYFDLEGEQIELFDVRLARFHAWHRREELPRYAQALDSAAARVTRGATRADVEWAVATVRARYRALAAQAIDESVPVLATLEPANYAALEKKLAAGNRKLTRELLEGEPAAREAARIDAISDRIEEWLGSVSAVQRTLIENHVRAHPVDAKLRLQNRTARQREFMRALRQERNSPALRDSLRAIFVDYDAQRRVEYARAWQAWQERAVTLITEILAVASRAQREYAAARLSRYADDFRALADDGRAQPGSGTRAAQEAAQPGT
jgi:hypothetical protein